MVRTLKQPPWRSEEEQAERCCPLSIKQIDAILQPLLLQESSSGSSSSEKKPIVQPVLELTSPYSGDGKTSLLYYIAARAALPHQYGGLEAAVVFIDNDGRFDAIRVHAVMLGFVASSVSMEDPDRDKSKLGDVVRDAMQHVHLLRPRSSVELLATLLDLPCYLLDATKHVSGERRIHSIMLDSASAFYFEDQEALSSRQRQVHLSDTTGQEPHKASSSSRTAAPLVAAAAEGGVTSGADTATALRKLQETFDCPVIFTTWGLNPHLQTSQLSSTADASNINRSIIFVPYLPPPWPSFPTCRLILRRENIRPFPVNISTKTSSEAVATLPMGEGFPATQEKEANPAFARAMAEAPRRQKALQRGRFVAWLDSSSCSRSAAQLANNCGGGNGNVAFEFFVTRTGVWLENS